METDKIIRALTDLGVEGPAVALDVLRYSGAYNRLQPHEVATVLHGMTQVMIEINRERTADDG